MSTPRRNGLVAGTALLGLAAAGWWLLYDDSSMGLSVLGGYRESRFLLLLAASWLGLSVLLLSLLAWRRAVVFRFVAVHAALGFAVLALEALAFFGIADYSRLLGLAPFDQPSAVARQLGVRHLTRANVVSDAATLPDLVLHLGADAEPVASHFSTDAFGLRNPTRKTDPRVVCLGDSVLVAGLVPDGALLTEQLQQQLQVEVMNCSEVRYSPQEEVLRLRATDLGVRGRLIVQFLFEGNDLSDSADWRQWREHRQASTWPPPGLLRSLLFLMKQPNRQGGMQRRARFRGSNPTDVWFLYDAGAFAAAAELDELARFVAATDAQIRQDGGRYAVCVVPMKLNAIGSCCDFPADSSVDRDPQRLMTFRERMRQACADAGIPFLDLTAALAASAARGDLPFFAADTHLNATGHRVVAAAVAAWSLPLLPPR